MHLPVASTDMTGINFTVSPARHAGERWGNPEGLSAKLGRNLPGHNNGKRGRGVGVKTPGVTGVSLWRAPGVPRE